MNNTILALVSILAVAGCTTPDKAQTKATTVTAPVPEGKLVAPVAMEAVLGDGSAKVTVRFESEASGVKLAVFGVDGLLVKGEPTVVADGAFKKGETKVFEVAFTPGAGRSHLAISVTGMFSGSKLDRVATFAIGTPTEAQLKGPGTSITTDDGQHIKLMPAKQE